MTDISEKDEITPGGSKIYRYDDTIPHEHTLVVGSEETIELISEHIEKHVGKIESVLHELISDIVHIDVYWVKPTPEQPFHTLITSGMSDLPMHVPEEYKDRLYAELCILLPEDWNMSQDTWEDESMYWPIRWLKILARFPHEYNTWISWGHTIPNGEGAEPFADNTGLGCMLLLPSLSLPGDFFELKVSEEKTIQFYCLYPLYKEEMDYKLEKGTDDLIDRFQEAGIMDIIDIARPNVCNKK